MSTQLFFSKVTCRRRQSYSICMSQCDVITDTYIYKSKRKIKFHKILNPCAFLVSVGEALQFLPNDHRLSSAWFALPHVVQHHIMSEVCKPGALLQGLLRRNQRQFQFFWLPIFALIKHLESPSNPNRADDSHSESFPGSRRLGEVSGGAYIWKPSDCYIA